MDKLDMKSPDFTDQNIDKLAELFPNCVTESKDEQGKLQKAIDFDLLKQELSDHIVDGARERYQLNWPGKREALLTANTPITKTLRPWREESVDFDTTENLFIEGDNLDALKLLQETYLGKVKMIYIDPPYNTGKDFIYEDNFTVDKDEYDLASEQKNEDGGRLVANLDSNGRFHSDWLDMMYPRLKLARNLLRNDGVIFISIDDNEVHNLRKVCDEIFGEGNFLANIVWQKKYAATNDAKGFSNLHDHIIVYQKSNVFTRLLLPRTKEQNKPYKHNDSDGKGLWRADNILVKSFSASCVYSIKNPNTGKEYFPPQGSSWRASATTMKEWLNENRVFFGKDGKGAPQLKRYLNQVQQGRVPSTWWSFKEVGHNDAANKELKALFNIKAPFDTPKPSTLIRQMLMVSANNNDIILDFFAGSATTAHAVMQLNAEDNGNRKFIMVQLPEVTDEKSEAYKAGYSTIAEISKERIRRAGKKIKEELAEKQKDKPRNTQNTRKDKKDDPSVCSVSSVVKDLDIGFRVLKIDSSNMKDVYYAPDAISQGDLLDQTDNIKEDRHAEDLLFQVLLDWGVDLSLPITREIIATKHTNNTKEKQKDFEVFFVDGNALCACFDAGVTEALVKELAKREPLRAVFRDSGYNSDSTKINIKQIFKLVSPHTEVKAI